MKKTLFSIDNDLFETLRQAKSEATVRQRILEQLVDNTGELEEGNTDFLHENILIEFKHNEDMSAKEGVRAEILAQSLYYCHNLYMDGKRVPPYISLIDKDEFVFYKRETLEAIYKQSNLFKQGSPSSPDEAVIEKCRKTEPEQYLFVSSQEILDQAVRRLGSIISEQICIPEDVTEYNIAHLYSSWSNLFTQFLNHKGNENKPHIFRKDCIGEGEVFVIESNLLGNEIITVEFNLDGEIAKIERCPKSKYYDFWSAWKRIENVKQEKRIFQKAADLFETDSRRKKGQFYTPTNLARYGWQYLEKELGKNFWFDGTWRIWDCCCGEGGLAINVIPQSALQYTYLSSLDYGEIDFVKKHLPMCKRVWQMDFLNTQIKDFPDDIKRDMENPNIKWLFFINPPYGEGSSGKADAHPEWHKKGVSLSLVKEQMKNHDMSVESKEKYAQFLFRIEKEFRGKYVLGSYTTMKAFVSKEYANLRKFWRPVFKGGLICCANKWHQGNGVFPSVFSVFDCREKGHWDKMTYNILEYYKNSVRGTFRGTKDFIQEDIKRSFRNYFFHNEKLPCDELTVVQANGLLTYSSKSKTSNYRPKKTLAAAYFLSAYMRRRQYSRLISGNSVSHNVFLDKQNYKQVLCGLGLYWSVKHTWVNHEDCFLAPSRLLTEQEETDAVLYALVCVRNRTTTARLDEAIITTNKGRVINGGIVENKLNPFDKKMFDWSACSETGKTVLKLYKDYLDNIVHWQKQDTVLGKGKWLGMYQYHRIVPIPKELVNAIEKLREDVEKTALTLCFV
ncbi:MAG: hypothetical protein LBT46_09935 [Planctomycetaceae bacterium]|jgi:predicted RNA methylase|nr:hypothetical protein [Planctomycetaceae bacterium]